jgi:hypothetical protein
MCARATTVTIRSQIAHGDFQIARPSIQSRSTIQPTIRMGIGRPPERPPYAIDWGEDPGQHRKGANDCGHTAAQDQDAGDEFTGSDMEPKRDGCAMETESHASTTQAGGLTHSAKSRYASVFPAARRE